MKKIAFILVILLIVFSILLFFRLSQLSIKPIQISNMKILSPSFTDGAVIPAKFTCKGSGVSPSLAISDVPAGTESLVIILEDPDSPVKTFFHWLLWNIDPKTVSIIENNTPVGSVQGINDFGILGYGGPCPQVGSHRYIFKLFALDTALELSPESKSADLLSAMNGHIVGQTQTLGVFP